MCVSSARAEAGILSGLVNLLMDGNELAVTKVTCPICAIFARQLLLVTAMPVREP